MAESQWDVGTGTAPEESRPLQLHIGDYVRILRKHVWLIVAILVAGILLGTGYLVRQPRIYRATGTLHIDTTPPEVLGSVKEVVDLGAGDYWSNKEFYETQYRIISSRDVLERVVEREGLDRDAEFLGVARIADPAKRAEATAAADAVGILQASLRVDPVKNSQLVEISIDDTDPERAAKLSNAVMDAYIERNLDRRMEGTRAASDWLGEQMGDLKTKLESSELALYNFKKDQDILSTSLEDRQNIISQRLVALNDSLNDVITRRVELESAVKEAEALRQKDAGNPLWALALGKVLDSTVVSALRQDLIDQEKEVATLAERYLDKHPQRVVAEEKLQIVRARLATESQAVVEAMRSEYRAVVTSEQRLKDLIEGVKAEAFELNKKEIDYKKLGREQSNNQRLYDLVLSRLKEADLTALLKANNIRKLEPALVPTAPIKPRPAMILFITLLLSSLAALGVAVLVEILDRTLKNEADVEQALGVPFLGMVPSINAAGARRRDRDDDPSRDLFVFNNPKSAAAECCRAIRTNLLFMSPDRELKRIAVTSSGPQEGKTTTCINVGVAMAQAGSRVLLIDTDMRRPRLHRAFGLSNEIGLSTVVVGETPVGSAIKTTDVPNLFVLPCGPVPPNPAELLHTERFREVLAQLGEQFDRLVFDTPPLIAVADAAVLSTAVDGVMLVTRFRKTTRDVARRVLRSLRDVNAPVLGAVMNDVDLESREYGYYYYRRYGYYYSEGGESAKA